MSELVEYRPRRETWWTKALRSITIGPWNPRDPAIARYFGGGASTLAGVTITEDKALQVSAVWSAVTMISDDIASLPLMLYKRLPNGGKDRFESHPLYRLLHTAPNPEMDSMVWRRTMQAHALIWQNAYAEIERDAAGRPRALWPLVPESVTVERSRLGELVYKVRNPSGSEVYLPAADVIHLVGFSHTGSAGSSMVSYARESIGLALAAEQYGSSFFGNGATVGGVVTVKGPKPSAQSEKEHTEKLEARHSGLARAHRLMLIYGDATYTPNVIAPNQGQFNETRVQQIREIARWFKMPPHKLGDLADATYSNVEQMDAAYYGSCLRPWLKLWEQQLSRKLIFPSEQQIQFIEHETHGFLSVDAQARAALYQSESRIGSITINEIRGYENRDPLEGGDRAFVEPGRIPLDRIDEWFDAEIKSKQTPKETKVVTEKTDEAKEEIKALTEALGAARKASTAYEEQRDYHQGAAERAVAERDAERTGRAADAEAFAAEAERLRQARDWFALDAHDHRIALDLAVQEVGTLKTEVDAVAARFAQAERDLTIVAAQFDGEVAARMAADLNAASALNRAAQSEQERDAAHREALAQAESAVLADAGRRAALEAAAVSETATARAMAELGALTIEADSLRADLARARADIAAELDKARTFKATMLAAMRSLFAEATERLLAKESNAARKHQATAEKLRSWADRFYPLHAETARDVFRPLVGPWTAITGEAPNLLLDRLVAQHVSASSTAVRAVAEADGDDERAEALERTLSRWESERADAMADALLREGMADHG